MKPLTEPQKQVLVAMLAYGGREAWTTCGLRLLMESRGVVRVWRRQLRRTMPALERRGLVQNIGWCRWSLTNEGRDTAEKPKADAAAPPTQEGEK